MEDSGSLGSSSSGANSGSGANSHKRVSAFLQQCGDAKKCKLDLERQLAAKRAEKGVMRSKYVAYKGKFSEGRKR